ncbi:hypothetical protein [Rhodococcus sp. 14-2470-1a]|uniref:VG15 protein n=1 Tax=Rhodococcus sp. 14-2470-1a TaxID=2023150 RepID=UPI0015C6823F|nr:hypothetical protein [Rhodococcus sp. 14-2470-1a]
MLPQPSAENYLRQQDIQSEALVAATQIWGPRPPKDFDSWFAANVDRLVAVVALAQDAAVAGAEDYVDDTLDVLGTAVAPIAEIAPGSLVGIASDGRPLDSLMYGPIISAKGEIGKSMAAGKSFTSDIAAQAWQTGLQALQMRVQTQVADANRVATGLAVTTRPGTGYVRMLNPPSCSRCTVLAGRFYRFSAGFLRHPGCDCRHVPAREEDAEDLRTDPMDTFHSLSAEMQDQIFTIAGAQAIRDGADIAQVVNARRGANGLATAGQLMTRSVYGRQLITTTEGVTKRGVAGKLIRARGRDPVTTPRLMPEDIYDLVGGDRAETLRLLQLNGYVLDRSGPAAGAGSRTGLVPKLNGDRGVVDLDAAQRARQAQQQVQALEAEQQLLAQGRRIAEDAADLGAQRRAAAPRFPFSVSAGVPAEAERAARESIARIPVSVREELNRQTVQLYMARKVSLLDDQAVRARYANLVTADGRLADDVSFFSPNSGDVIISTDPGHGSVDLVAHELGHAIDYRALRRNPPVVSWQEQGSRSLPASARAAAQREVSTTVYAVQDDPYVKWAHDRVSKLYGDAYYRLGSVGTKKSGRSEWVAEGYAAVLNGNRSRLENISGYDNQAADVLAWTFRRLGLIE